MNHRMDLCVVSFGDMACVWGGENYKVVYVRGE